MRRWPRMITGVLLAGASGCSSVNPAYEGGTGVAESGSTSITGASRTATGRAEASSGDAGEGEGGRTTSGGGSSGSSDGIDSSGGESTGSQDCACQVIEPCVDDSNSPAHALGLGCEGAPLIVESAFANSEAIAMLSTLGDTNTYYLPTEGSLFLAMGTGPIDSLIDPEGNCTAPEPTPQDQFDLGPMLPPPIVATDVEGDCLDDPSLVGMGDCSNTLQDELEYNPGGGMGDISVQLQDYAEVRFTTLAPEGADGFEIDYAFFTSEFPGFEDLPEFNDMFIVWLESERWTGNIAFDGGGDPLSANSANWDFEYRDVEIAGTCMAGHTATDWHTGFGPVQEQQPLTVILAIWDAGLPDFDSYALIDGFRWNCGACD